MLTSGLRISEVSALKMTDIYLGEAPSRMIIRGKGSRERTVYLSSEAEQDLDLWLEKRSKTRCEYVFITYNQRKISTTSINNRISHIRKCSGVNLTAHMLRHTFADRLLFCLQTLDIVCVSSCLMGLEELAKGIDYIIS
jgi:site-specific recombinase XerD